MILLCRTAPYRKNTGIHSYSSISTLCSSNVLIIGLCQSLPQSPAQHPPTAQKTSLALVYLRPDMCRHNNPSKTNSNMTTPAETNNCRSDTHRNQKISQPPGNREKPLLFQRNKKSAPEPESASSSKNTCSCTPSPWGAAGSLRRSASARNLSPPSPSRSG